MRIWGSLLVASVLALAGMAVAADARTLTKAHANAKARQVARHIAAARGADPKLARKDCFKRISPRRFRCAISYVPSDASAGFCVGTISVFYRADSRKLFTTPKPKVRCGFGGPTTDPEEGPP